MFHISDYLKTLNIDAVVQLDQVKLEIDKLISVLNDELLQEAINIKVAIIELQHKVQKDFVSKINKED